MVVRNYPLPRPTREQLEADGKLNANPHAYQTAFLIGGTNLAGKNV
jgi:hypothetical protein